MTMTIRAVLGAVTAAALVAATPASAGECKKVAAAGDGFTRSIAEFMAQKGLKNVIDGYGMKAQGQMAMKCDVGSVYVECHASQTACK